MSLVSVDEKNLQGMYYSGLHGHQPRGRPTKTYVDQLMDDTRGRLKELPIEMEDREGWKGRVIHGIPSKLNLMVMINCNNGSSLSESAK